MGAPFFAPPPRTGAGLSSLAYKEPRQQCAEDQIDDNGFPQGAGRQLVASRYADVAGDHDAGGQRHPEPEPEHPCSLLGNEPQRAASI